MKIAIPLKTNKEDSSITPVFGKAKWFAFVEDGKITINKNEASNGAGVIEWLLKSNITSIIIKNMSKPPYQMAKKSGQINIYYAGGENIGLQELIKKYEAEELVIVDDTNENEIIKDHQRKHKNR